MLQRARRIEPERFWLPLTILGLVFVVCSFLPPGHGWDLYAYWTVDPRDPYGGQDPGLSVHGSFFYAPPIAWLMAPLRLLPWEAAVIVWLVLQLGALWLIAGRWALALVVFPPVWLDLVYGNVNVMLAASLAIGFRHPAAWAFVLLTKVTPGVGLVWFAIRREWRALAISGTVTTVALLATLPQLPDWLAVLDEGRTSVVPAHALDLPLYLRLPAAAALIAWGGMTNRRWTVPVGATLAMPVLWPIALAPLVALVPLLRPGPLTGERAFPQVGGRLYLSRTIR